MSQDSSAIDTSDDAILSRLKALISQGIEEDRREAMDIDSLTTETALLSLPLDSMAVMQLMSGVEQEYTVYISEEQAFEFQTIGDLIRFIQEKVATRAARAAARQGS